MTFVAEHRDATERERAFYGGGVTVHTPATVEALREIVRFAEAENLPIVPAGGGSHVGIADPAPDDALIVSTRAFDAVHMYEPDDFTVGVGAGMPLATLQAKLAANGQEIPVDFNDPGDGTAGGLVAVAPVGPRTAFAGPIRSHLLGVEGLRGEGKQFRSGGMVVKNVAGYQLDKFLVGSLGAAAFLLRVNFKLRPIPARRRLRFLGFASADEAWGFVRTFRAAHLEPSVLSVLAGAALDDARGAGHGVPPGERAVAIVFEGRTPAVTWQLQQLESHLFATDAEVANIAKEDDARRLITYLTRFADAPPHFEAHGAVRLGVVPSKLGKLEERVQRWFQDADGFRAGTCADADAGYLSVRWNGPREAIDHPVAPLRDAAQVYEGSSRLLFLPPHARPSWNHILDPDPHAATTERVHRVFDPAGVFGRKRV